MSHWFIFTSCRRVFGVQADSLSKAVAAFKRSKRSDVGEIIGVIMGTAEIGTISGVVPTPVAGVIICYVTPPAARLSASAKS